MNNWLILQNFYNGLTQTARDHADAAAGGAFFSLTPKRATSLVEKMVSNQGWSDDWLQPRQRGMHSVKETDMLATKIDLLLKKFEGYPQDKAQIETLQVLDARMSSTTMGFVHKEVKGEANHAYFIKEAMEIQISIQISLPWGI